MPMADVEKPALSCRNGARVASRKVMAAAAATVSNIRTAISVCRSSCKGDTCALPWPTFWTPLWPARSVQGSGLGDGVDGDEGAAYTGRAVIPWPNLRRQLFTIGHDEGDGQEQHSGESCGVEGCTEPPCRCQVAASKWPDHPAESQARLQYPQCRAKVVRVLEEPAQALLRHRHAGKLCRGAMRHQLNVIALGGSNNVESLALTP